MRRWAYSCISLVMALGACTGGGDTTDSTTTSVPATTVPEATTSSLLPTTTTTEDPGPVLIPSVEVVGPPEMVFDWTTDRCEPENIPDIASRAFRDSEGQVQLIIGHYVNYRMIGPSLEEVSIDCSAPVLESAFDPDPSRFSDSEWIGSLYTLDGETVYALVHNEYRGDTHTGVRPDQCPSGDRLTCLDTSITLFVSTDGGDTYEPAVSPPQHLVATLPYVFDDEGVPSGLRQVSNIIRGPDDYFYAFSNISDYPVEDQWVCGMRTEDLADPGSWRFWTGSDFSGRFVDPYADPVESDADKCAPMALPQLSASVQEAVVYDESLGMYVMMGTTFNPITPDPQMGVYYSFSEDLVNWSTRQLLLELDSYGSVADFDNDAFYAYVSVLDPDSSSLSFDTSNGSAYLYITRFNAGTHSLDRDLVRFPIELRYVEAVAPEWDFDTDGDTQGWVELHDVDPLRAIDGSLVIESTGSDPYFGSGSIRIPAEFDEMAIRMKVSEGPDQLGQLFFGTTTAPEHTERTSVLFDVIADGEFHEYRLDLSSVAAWEGEIISLRLDPVMQSGRTIEIDRIWFPGSAG